MSTGAFNENYRPHMKKSQGVFTASDLEKLNFLLNKGMDLPAALERYQRVVFYDGMTLRQVAEKMVAEGRFGGIPEPLRHLVNVNNIVRHLRERGYCEEEEGVYGIEENRFLTGQGLYLVFEEQSS